MSSHFTARCNAAAQRIASGPSSAGKRSHATVSSSAPSSEKGPIMKEPPFVNIIPDYFDIREHVVHVPDGRMNRKHRDYVEEVNTTVQRVQRVVEKSEMIVCTKNYLERLQRLYEETEEYPNNFFMYYLGELFRPKHMLRTPVTQESTTRSLESKEIPCYLPKAHIERMDEEARRLQKLVFHQVHKRISHFGKLCEMRIEMLADVSAWLLSQQNILCAHLEDYKDWWHSFEEDCDLTLRTRLQQFMEFFTGALAEIKQFGKLVLGIGLTPEDEEQLAAKRDVKKPCSVKIGQTRLPSEMDYLPAWSCKVIQRFNGYKFAVGVMSKNPDKFNWAVRKLSDLLTLCHELSESPDVKTTLRCGLQLFNNMMEVIRSNFEDITEMDDDLSELHKRLSEVCGALEEGMDKLAMVTAKHRNLSDKHNQLTKKLSTVVATNDKLEKKLGVLDRVINVISQETLHPPLAAPDDIEPESQGGETATVQLPVPSEKQFKKTSVSEMFRDDAPATKLLAEIISDKIPVTSTKTPATKQEQKEIRNEINWYKSNVCDLKCQVEQLLQYAHKLEENITGVKGPARTTSLLLDMDTVTVDAMQKAAMFQEERLVQQEKAAKDESTKIRDKRVSTKKKLSKQASSESRRKSGSPSPKTTPEPSRISSAKASETIPEFLAQPPQMKEPLKTTPHPKAPVPEPAKRLEPSAGARVTEEKPVKEFRPKPYAKTPEVQKIAPAPLRQETTEYFAKTLEMQEEIPELQEEAAGFLEETPEMEDDMAEFLEETPEMEDDTVEFLEEIPEMQDTAEASTLSELLHKTRPVQKTDRTPTTAKAISAAKSKGGMKPMSVPQTVQRPADIESDRQGQKSDAERKPSTVLEAPAVTKKEKSPDVVKKTSEISGRKFSSEDTGKKTGVQTGAAKIPQMKLKKQTSRETDTGKVSPEASTGETSLDIGRRKITPAAFKHTASLDSGRRKITPAAFKHTASLDIATRKPTLETSKLETSLEFSTKKVTSEVGKRKISSETVKAKHSPRMDEVKTDLKARMIQPPLPLPMKTEDMTHEDVRQVCMNILQQFLFLGLKLADILDNHNISAQAEDIRQACDILTDQLADQNFDVIDELATSVEAYFLTIQNSIQTALNSINIKTAEQRLKEIREEKIQEMNQKTISIKRKQNILDEQYKILWSMYLQLCETINIKKEGLDRDFGVEEKGNIKETPLTDAEGNLKLPKDFVSNNLKLMETAFENKKCSLKCVESGKECLALLDDQIVNGHLPFLVRLYVIGVRIASVQKLVKDQCKTHADDEARCIKWENWEKAVKARLGLKFQSVIVELTQWRKRKPKIILNAWFLFNQILLETGIKLIFPQPAVIAAKDEATRLQYTRVLKEVTKEKSVPLVTPDNLQEVLTTGRLPAAFRKKSVLWKKDSTHLQLDNRSTVTQATADQGFAVKERGQEQPRRNSGKPPGRISFKRSTCETVPEVSMEISGSSIDINATERHSFNK